MTSRAEAAPAASEILRTEANTYEFARARATMADHGRLFDAFEAEALRAHANDDPLAAAAWAQIAVNVGWAFPSGSIASTPLDHLLGELGRTHVPGGESTVRPSDPARVLHVLSEAYATGGHTRVVERWVARDPREATVVVTRQPGALPGSLTEAVGRSGGTLVHALAGGDLFERARALRALADAHDLVVLHTHMHDVLPSLAFADRQGRPPTILFEHASHMMWLGSGVADVVACMRPVDARVAHTRRGIGAERIHVLPLPRGERIVPPRDQARRILQIADEAPVILTIASPWKVLPVVEPTMGEICSAVMDAVPGALLLVAGPAPDEQWRPVLRSHGTRVRMLGAVRDIGPLLAAADVYLDSWPVSGSTTILDVASAGVPIVALGDGSESLEMIQALTPLRDGAVQGDTPALVGRATAELIADPGRREQMRHALADAVAREHDGGWSVQLERLVAAASARARSAHVPATITEPPVADWQCVIELQLGGRSGYTLGGVVQANADVLPAEVAPRTPAAAAALADRIVAEHAAANRAERRRVVVAPPLEPAAVADTVTRLRALQETGEVDECIVVVAPDRMPDALRLLQAALDAQGDLDIDVAPGTLAEVARPRDLVIAIEPAQPLSR